MSTIQVTANLHVAASLRLNGMAAVQVPEATADKLPFGSKFKLNFPERAPGIPETCLVVVHGLQVICDETYLLVTPMLS